jgi:hypothetical protein
MAKEMKAFTLQFILLIILIITLVTYINDRKEVESFQPLGELPIQKVIIVTDSNLPKTNFNFTPLKDRQPNPNLPAVFNK